MQRGRTIGYVECEITDEENRLVARLLPLARCFATRRPWDGNSAEPRIASSARWAHSSRKISSRCRAIQPFLVRLSGGSNCHALDLSLPSHHSRTSSGPVKPRPSNAEKYLHHMRPSGRISIKMVMGATKLGSIFNAANDAVEQALRKTSLAELVRGAA